MTFPVTFFNKLGAQRSLTPSQDQKTMDLDNPSYFSVPDEPSSTYKAFCKRRDRFANTDSISSASDCSLTRQLTPPRNHKLRSLLRSVSSNSADSNQELLIMGEPRLSDFAPDIAARHTAAARTNSLKSTKYDPHSDLMYCPLPTSEEAADSCDEVFVTEDSARYYNFPSKKETGQRRHSIGTFMARDRVNSAASSSRSFKDFPRATAEGPASVSEIDDHSIRHASYPRKRCLRCTKGVPSKPANMDDILIVSLKCSEAATLWVEYFSNYFQQINKQTNRKGFKIQYLGVEEVVENKEIKPLTDKTSGVKLQLIVICPNLLEFISQNTEECQGLGNILLADRTQALLLGVKDSDINDVHLKVLPTYFQWQRKTVGQDQDENFTKEFLSQAMAILSKIWKQQSSVLAQEKSCFSVTPKKIRQGQNSVFIILTYPLQKEDIVKVSVEKNGEMYEITSTKRRNPYLIKMTLPEHLTEVTAIVNILVEKNGSIIGSRPIKCESKLRELEQILRLSNNPIEFMCQTLGFTPADKEHLDNWMVQAFQRNLPQHFNILANHNTPFSAAVQAHKRSNEEYPTLLHFAAKFGLEKLSMQLLDCPGADVAYEIRNIHDLTPVDIAEANGHTELCGMLKGYMNMNEITSMYAKLKEFSQKTKNSDTDPDGYLTPKHVEEFYKICPSPRPVEFPPLPHSPVSECATPVGYMSMNTLAQITSSNDDLSKKYLPTEPIPKIKKEPDVISKAKPQPSKIPDIIEDKVQKELAEIINDFKNNVHSISQVEKLVDEWKNRNDVKKSFKEKQEQLYEMRLRYEKIQQEMKNTLKKPTPFDRIKKLFSRPKGRDEKLEVSSPTSSLSANNNSQRPVSALSTSSSGSSGRMSTLSGCSLGDSGTHSDNEDRKNVMMGSHNEEEFRNEINKVLLEMQYTPLPAPKPVKMFPPKHTFETIEEKPVRPDTLPITEDFYIHFPPSGLPVPGLIDESENSEDTSRDYMNVSAQGNLGKHEYMNYKSPTMR